MIASGFLDNNKKKAGPELDLNPNSSPLGNQKEERATESPEIKTPKKVDSTKLTPKPLEDEDDDWSSIPAFLRRPKNK